MSCIFLNLYRQCPPYQWLMLKQTRVISIVIFGTMHIHYLSTTAAIKQLVLIDSDTFTFS